MIHLVEMIKNIFILTLLLSYSVSGFTQNLQNWNVFPSFSTINSVSVDHGITFSATLGGVFAIEDGDIISQMTTLDGLYRSNPSTIVVESHKNRLFAGYIDGTIDVINIETEEIDRVEDINRVSRFNSKGINAFKIYDNRLYVATSFGIVVYNLESLLVENSYLKLGQFDIGTQVNNIDIVSDSIYVATTQGLAIGDLNQNLVESSNWSNYTEGDGLPVNIIDQVAVFENRIHVMIEGSIYSLLNGTWQTNNDFPSEGINSLEKNSNNHSLAAATNSSVTVLDTTGNTEVINLDLESSITMIMLEGEKLYIGTTNEGLVVLESLNGTPEYYLPTGPYLNFFGNVQTDGNTLIASSTTAFPSFDPFNTIRGYYIYEDSTWHNYNRNTRTELANTETVYSVGMNDSSYYFGSWGRGIIRHNKSTNDITVYNRNNSSLLGINEAPNYVVISALDSDRQNNMWAVSYDSDFSLYVQLHETEEWIPFRSRVSGETYFELFIDSFDQKWISLITNTNLGRGLMVLDTGEPEDPNDDESVVLTSASGNGNLPDEKIKAIIQDQNDEVWIGTERGIARFIFPELIIDGGEQERQAQWLINEDTTAVSRFLLRDVNVSTMAVNAANQKWIGSVNQGIWVLNEEGSRIINRFTTENSNLISDNIESITINDENGEVFIATDLGLVSYYEIPKAPVKSMDKLKVFPNPFKYSRHNQVVVEGLSKSTRIKVIGVDGIVVNELTGQGGRITWDGYDYNGNQLGTGVYFLVAYEGSGRETGVGKVVIVN